MENCCSKSAGNGARVRAALPFCAPTAFSARPLPTAFSHHPLPQVGKMRAEGKDYVVQDGDVMLFRFNV